MTQVKAAPSTTKRITALDALRGFALFGVLITNIFLFNTTSQQFDSYYAQFSDSLNQGGVLLVKFLFRSRFYPIFAFLFGLGLGLQYNTLASKGNATAFLVRRLLVLLVFGLIHYIFIWDGDILLEYALAGFLLVALAHLNKQQVLAITLTVYLLHSLYAYLTAAEAAPAVPVLSDQPVDVMALPYHELVRERALGIWESMFSVANLMFNVKIFSFIAFGLYVSKSFDFRNYKPDLSKYIKAFSVLLGLRVVLALVTYSLGQAGLTSDSIIKAASFASFALNPALYVFGFLILYFTGPGAVMLAPLAAVGRMTLTNYVVQSLVLSWLFYGYGLGLFQRWQPFQHMLFGLCFFLLQAAASAIWLTYFRQGPLEHLWRYLAGSYTIKKH